MHEDVIVVQPACDSQLLSPRGSVPMLHRVVQLLMLRDPPWFLEMTERAPAAKYQRSNMVDPIFVGHLGLQ